MSPFKQFIFGAAQFQEREECLEFQYKFLIVLILAVIGAVGFFLGALLWVEQAPSPSRFVAPHSGTELVDTWKIFVSYAAPGTGNKDTYPHRVISTPFVAGPGTISTETYLCIGPFDSEAEAESALSYLTCRLTRLLIQLRKASQHVTSRVYSFVPTQTWDRTWTDAELYTKYGLSENEIAFIEKIVRPMEID